MPNLDGLQRHGVRHGRAPRKTPGNHLLAVATLLVTGACSGDMEVARDRVVVRDSVGVVISENMDSVTNAHPWSVGKEATLTIGQSLTAPAEYQFASIGGAIRLPEGGVLVADRGVVREYAHDDSPWPGSSSVSGYALLGIYSVELGTGRDGVVGDDRSTSPGSDGFQRRHPSDRRDFSPARVV